MMTIDSQITEELGLELMHLSEEVWPSAYKTATRIKLAGLAAALPTGWEAESDDPVLIAKYSPERLHKHNLRKLIRYAFFVIEEIKETQVSFSGDDVPERFKLQLSYRLNDRIRELIDTLRGGALKNAC